MADTPKDDKFNIDWSQFPIPANVNWDELYNELTKNPEKIESMVKEYMSSDKQWLDRKQEILQIKKQQQEEAKQLIDEIEKNNEEFDRLYEELQKPNISTKTTTITETIYYDDEYTYYSEPIQRVIDIDELRERMAKLEANKVDTTGNSVVVVNEEIKNSCQTQTEDKQNVNQLDTNDKNIDNNTDDENLDLSVIYEGTSGVKTDTKPITTQLFERKTPKVGVKVFAASNGILTYSWKPAKVSKILNHCSVSVNFDDRSVVGGSYLFNKLIAYSTPSDSILPVGERVIAYLDDNGQREFYSGIVAEPAKNTNHFRYLIFFDKQDCRYVRREEIFHIYDRVSADNIFSENEKAMNPSVKEYCDFLVNYIKKYPERPMVRLQKGDERIKVRFDNRWESVNVLEIDASLALIHFHKLPKPYKEWIYRGSIKLYDIYKECQIMKTNVKHRGMRSTTRSTRNRDHSSFVEWEGEREEEKENEETKDQMEGDDDIQVIPTDIATRKRKNLKQTARKSTAKPSGTILDPMRLIDNELFNISEVSVEQLPDLSRVKPREYFEHSCSPDCINASVESDSFYDQNPFYIPIVCGYRRELLRTNDKLLRVVYRTPCGLRLRNTNELFNYLLQTESVLDIDLFTFAKGFALFRKSNSLKAYFHIKDITNGLEPMPISCVNTVDQTDLGNVVYSAKRFPHSDVYSFKPVLDPEFLSCCDCTDNCLNSDRCSCQQLTLEASDAVRMSKFQYFGYEFKRLNDFIMTGLFECNQRCSCNQRCPNRVIQKGIKCRLQLFKTLKKGWGVRVLHDVPKGTFLCTYSAQILNEEAADKEGKTFGDEYLADLDYIDVCENQKEGYESDVDLSDEDYRDSSDDNFDSNYNDDEDKDYKYSRNDELGFTTRELSTGRRRQDDRSRGRYSIREDFYKEDFCYSLDAKRKGNIGRYLNHSCEPNCFVQNVFVDTHDLRFPWVSFFAKKDIVAYEELTWDYNYEIGSIEGRKMYCYCGAARCKKRLL